MPTHKGIQCTILVNGRPLQEYQGDAECSELHTIPPVYVEAQDSTAFSIRCEILPSYQFIVGNRVSFRVYTNGKIVCRHHISEKSRHRSLTIEGPISVDKSGRASLHPFQFAGVSLVEDHDSEVRIDPHSLAAMGGISVYAIRTSLTGSKVRQHSKPVAAPEMETFEKVNEKALKGKDLTHMTKLGPKKEVRYKTPAATTEEHDTIESPFAHFRFQYTSSGALQNLGLIPRPPLPSATQNVPSKEKSMELEIAQLRAELESRDSKPSIKREIKREHKGIQQAKRPKILSAVSEVETIDLTGDD